MLPLLEICGGAWSALLGLPTLPIVIIGGYFRKWPKSLCRLKTDEQIQSMLFLLILSFIIPIYTIIPNSYWVHCYLLIFYSYWVHKCCCTFPLLRIFSLFALICYHIHSHSPWNLVLSSVNCCLCNKDVSFSLFFFTPDLS